METSHTQKNKENVQNHYNESWVHFCFTKNNNEVPGKSKRFSRKYIKRSWNYRNQCFSLSIFSYCPLNSLVQDIKAKQKLDSNQSERWWGFFLPCQVTLPVLSYHNSYVHKTPTLTTQCKWRALMWNLIEQQSHTCSNFKLISIKSRWNYPIIP